MVKGMAALEPAPHRNIFRVKNTEKHILEAGRDGEEEGKKRAGERRGKIVVFLYVKGTWQAKYRNVTKTTLNCIPSLHPYGFVLSLATVLYLALTGTFKTHE